MMQKPVFFILIVCACLASCASARRERINEGVPPAALYAFREETAGGEYQIIDYQGKNRGLPLPWWVEPYLRGGAAAVEDAAGAELGAAGGAPAGSYVFVSVQKSANLAALLQWKNFQKEPDFSAMIFPRMYRRCIRGIGASPERYYGSFFSTLLKTLADISWPEAALNSSVWLIVRLPAGNTPPPNGEAALAENVNMVLSLALVDKPTFERKVGQVLDKIPRDRTLSRDQRAAVKRLRSAFFVNF